jgi:hypothetical protein
MAFQINRGRKLAITVTVETVEHVLQAYMSGVMPFAVLRNWIV